MAIGLYNQCFSIFSDMVSDITRMVKQRYQNGMFFHRESVCILFGFDLSSVGCISEKDYKNLYWLLGAD